MGNGGSAVDSLCLTESSLTFPSKGSTEVTPLVPPNTQPAPYEEETLCPWIVETDEQTWVGGTAFPKGALDVTLLNRFLTKHASAVAFIEGRLAPLALHISGRAGEGFAIYQRGCHLQVKKLRIC